MKGNKAKTNTKEKSNSKSEKNEEKRKSCGQCRFYDWTRERQFHRRVGKRDEHGKRTLIVEPRSVCISTKARAGGHLVHRDQTKRPCSQFEAGKYEPPKKEEKKKPTKETKEPETPEEYFGKPKELEQLEELIEKAKKSKTSVEKNKLNGEKKTLTVKRGKVTVK